MGLGKEEEEAGLTERQKVEKCVSARHKAVQNKERPGECNPGDT